MSDHDVQPDELPPEHSADSEAPEADVLEQEAEVEEHEPTPRPDRDPEVPEADALEQAMDVGPEEEEREG